MKQFLLFAVVLMAAGCASSSSAVTSDDDLTGAHFPAGNCEVFVDRALPISESHGVGQLTLFVKTPLGKLDAHGGIKSVGYHAQEIVEGKGGPFHDIVASTWAGSADYWRLAFTMTSDVTPTTAFKGAFYVEAGDGTRFWVNASAGGKDFVLDSNMLGNLWKLRAPGYFLTSDHRLPPTAIVAADEFPYLNAQRCR
jgi:hypothetical protein